MAVVNAESNVVNLESNNEWTEAKINARLLELGLTMEQIDYLNWESKLEIAKEDTATEVLSFNRTTHSFNENNNSFIKPMSLTDDIALNIVAINMGNSGGHPYLKVVADYDWSSMPFYRLNDAFAITWSEGWYGNSWGFTEQQKYCVTDGSGCGSYTWSKSSIATARDQDRLAGVGWLYDLKGGSLDAKGTAYVYLIGNDEATIKSTTYSAFKAWYGHDKASSNIGISIGYGSAGVSAGVDFGGEEYTTDSTSIKNSTLTY